MANVRMINEECMLYCMGEKEGYFTALKMEVHARNFTKSNVTKV
jgi:hypothetical protein